MLEHQCISTLMMLMYTAVLAKIDDANKEIDCEGTDGN
tara:strand:+ start:323 stop:436 length:114 start_codon:yes stop_codon:yes gene_type:complete